MSCLDQLLGACAGVEGSGEGGRDGKGPGLGPRAGAGSGDGEGGGRGAALRALVALVGAEQLPLAVAMDALVQARQPARPCRFAVEVSNKAPQDGGVIKMHISSHVSSTEGKTGH